MSNPVRDYKNQIVLGAITGQGFETVVDVGVGSINHTQFEELYVDTKDKFSKVIGIDAFEKNITDRKAKYVGDSRYKFFSSDALDYDFSAEKPDLVTLFHVAEHLSLEDLSKLIKKIQSVDSVKMILLETPNEFEDGSGVANLEGNKYQNHKSLINLAFLSKFGFDRLFSYQQYNSTFNNTIYIFER